MIGALFLRLSESVKSTDVFRGWLELRRSFRDSQDDTPPTVVVARICKNTDSTAERALEVFSHGKVFIPREHSMLPSGEFHKTGRCADGGWGLESMVIDAIMKSV